MQTKSWRLFVLACVLAALMPLLLRPQPNSPSTGFPGWPSSFEGKTLRQLPLTPLEARFAENFPGRMGRFTDGQREIILRWVSAETRKLHPATDCFRGSGYQVRALPIKFTASGEHWGRFQATRGSESILVEERIVDSQGQQWTDVSAWYWAALWQKSASPWWAMTIAYREAPA